MTNAGVSIFDMTQTLRGWGVTDVDGWIRITNVPVGDYKILFRSPSGRTQWATQKSDFATADPIAIQAGVETVHREISLPTGGIDLTVRDARTAEPTVGACLSTLSGPMPIRGCTNGAGRLVISQVTVGTYTLLVTPPQGYLTETLHDVVVSEDHTTALAVAATKAARLAFTMRDKATGTPVSGACVTLVEAGARGVVGTESICADDQGLVRFDGMRPGRHRAFVRATDSVHGSQWVGVHGGTGNIDRAKWIEAVAGQTAHTAVDLDRAGTISGTVTAARDGRPVHGLCPTVTPAGPSPSQPAGVTCTAADGRYTISGLGPYDWRPQFPDYTGAYAWTWSGGAAHRLDARAITVYSGRNRTVDVRLADAGTVTGRLIGATRPSESIVVRAFNDRTGDYAAPEGRILPGPEYVLTGLGSQKLVITYLASVAPDVACSGPVEVEAGGVAQLDLVVPTP
ncbi:carboxypeptidase-like regulatory domain-containing protein [Alloactinosynnema sp. L-07]|uniref:carboxypeptidase-like regulatory domain-containing protein n=1 Tax=Alloactinosynnema sp. L-07 TaxID=1653480 RepID=UPI0012F9E21F|nr:carboxypeptidase-like regulatory domain-containing protein [Alloactinosynnema sp. L-07]